MGQREKVLPTGRGGGGGGGGAAANGGGGERGSGGVVGWETLLRQMPLRVLLVEGDDSTRHIIAALLRKCSFRVAAASDGLKAWETLKERAHSVDLVLTEVELPVISGFVLLTMIMEHEACRHIPVIMMSSHDSVSMVFKCMLKGAADFLVKPVRKNELRNLWQHVWRRRFASGGHGGLQCHYKSLEERKPGADIENNASNYSSEYVACMQTCMDNSEKASDAQSSCTRSDMEAESMYMQSMQESRKPRSMVLTHLDNTAPLNDEKHLQSGSTLVMLEDEQEEGSTLLGSEVSPCNEVCYSSEVIPEEDDASMVKLTVNEYAVPKGFGDYNDMVTETNEQTHDEAKHSKEVVDLIGSMDNRQQCPNKQRDGAGPKNNLPSPAEFLVHEKNSQFMSNSIPLLELSLKRYYHSGCHKKENDECSTLNHSNSSAFSLYNGRTVLPTSSTPMNSGFEQDEYFTGVKSLWNQDFGNGSNAAQYNGAAPHMNQEDAKLPSSGLPSQDGMAIQAPLRVIHFPVPIVWQANGPVMHYPQSGHTIPTMWQETVQGSLSYQSDPENPKTVQSKSPDGQSAKCSSNQLIERMEENMEVLDKQKHISSATGESGDSNICIGSRSHFNGRECSGSLCFVSNGNSISQNICKSPIKGGNDENGLASDGYKPLNYHHLNLREAALTKFRMKRKDRCYDKKVRYQSRKRLAEQRPRVKGQFVRQVQLSNSTNG